MPTQDLITKSTTRLSQFSGLALAKMPPYLQGTIALGNESFATLEFLDGIRESVIIALTCSTAITHRENNVAAKFEQLANEVKEDCIVVSSPTLISTHPSYQRIISLGEQIITLLIKKLDDSPTLWFKALNVITGVNPIPKSHKGNITLMVIDWKNWATENGYV